MERSLKKYIKIFLQKKFNNLLLKFHRLPLTVNIDFYLMKEKSNLIKLRFYHYIYFNDKILTEGVSLVKNIQKELMTCLLIDLDLTLEQFYKYNLLFNEDESNSRYEVW